MTTGFDWRDTLNVHIELKTESCITCGVPFAMPADLIRHLRDHPGTRFYCPTGHHMIYTGKTEAQKEREKRERVERQLRIAHEDLDAEITRHRATRKELTAARRRASHGVCPVPECRRSFANLAAHMRERHADYVGRADVDAGVHPLIEGTYGSMRKQPRRGQGPAWYDCACGWHGSTAGGRAGRHARTCAQARQPWPESR